MKIAITGCGIGGLAFANFAARAGFDVTLFDQFNTAAPVGSGLVIQPVGLRILERLGAAQEALDKGAKGYHMIGYESRSGRKVLDVSYGALGGDSFGLGIHRASLFTALLNAATNQGIKVTPNHKVTRTTLTDAGRFLHFEDGKTAGPFDLVVDASGASSPLSPLKAKPLPYGAIWATVDWPDDCALQYDRLHQRYRRAHNMIGVLPIGTLPDQTTRKAALFWSLPRNQFQDWQNTPIAQWRSDAKTLWPELAPFVDQITDHSQMTLATYTHGSSRKPYADRIVYIGDAAHRASPQLGQGANMALLDAYALCEALKSYTLAQALHAYVVARRPHTALYQTMSWAFTPMYQSDSRLLPLLRDYILAPLSTFVPVSSILTSLVKGTMVPPHRGF